MSNTVLETWAWVCIYVGLLLVMLGLYMQSDGGNGWPLKLLGAVLVVPGVLMILVRAKRGHGPRDGD
jgi:vacuolar-type H+-ATPase subunit I/STV1